MSIIKVPFIIDMLPHHRIPYNDVVFLPNFNLNITLARL